MSDSNDTGDTPDPAANPAPDAVETLRQQLHLRADGIDLALQRTQRRLLDTQVILISATLCIISVVLLTA